MFNCDKQLHQNKAMDITIDGLKRIYNDNSWLLLRPSGTEPLFRVYSDAMTQERADYLIVEAERIVNEAIQENL
jgi:phosphomannomutase